MTWGRQGNTLNLLQARTHVNDYKIERIWKTNDMLKMQLKHSTDKCLLKLHADLNKKFSLQKKILQATTKTFMQNQS